MSTPVYAGYRPLGDEKELQDSRIHRRRQLTRVVTATIAFMVVGWAFMNLGSSSHPIGLSDHPEVFEAPSPIEKCSSHSSRPPPASPPSPVNLWASLTIEETSEIQAWLEKPERNLNLTRAATSVPSDNVVYLIETFYPPKAKALAHLANPDAVSPPPRHARVTIHHGAQKEPTVKDYLVGPLPVGDGTKMEELTDIYHRDIPHHARGFVTVRELYDAMKAIKPDLRDAIEDLFNATLRGTEADTLVTIGSGPFSFDGSFRRAWITFKRNVPGSWLHSSGLYLYADIGGTDSSQWKVSKAVYHHQYFNSIDTFLDAYRNGSLERYPPLPDDKVSDSWSSRKRVGERRDLDDLPGPRSVSFAGLRFRVDKERQYVSWMGWGFYLGFDRDMGLSLWDIRFKEERIIYQLAPQEALAHYAGNDPVQATTAWQDRHFGMGQMVSDMLPGYDCPHTAVYLPATTRTPEGSITVERAICVFEHDTERPISRHTSYVDGEFGAVKGYVLVIRSVSTVGNYDYTFDYVFHLDGTIEVRVSASGYLQGGYWDSRQDSYGSRIQDRSMGNIHDHVINFKVDFDIGGIQNSLLEATTQQEEIEQPWLDDDWGHTIIQQKIIKRYIENEDEARLKYPHNFQGYYAIVNQEERNAWGYPKGYMIHPGFNPVYSSVTASRRTLENANWAKYNMAVSKRKETEPSSSSMWNMNLPGAPVVDFHKFFDGENITQEDLVAWVNVGTHHLPQAEDSPNTKMNVATSSFILTPLNYFDHDVSMESTNAIFLTSPKKPGEPFTYDDYGVEQGFTCIPEPPEPFSYFPVPFFDEEGKKAEPKTAEEMRERSEMTHRVRVDL